MEFIDGAGKFGVWSSWLAARDIRAGQNSTFFFWRKTNLNLYFLSLFEKNQTSQPIDFIYRDQKPLVLLLWVLFLWGPHDELLQRKKKKKGKTLKWSPENQLLYRLYNIIIGGEKLSSSTIKFNIGMKNPMGVCVITLWLR